MSAEGVWTFLFIVATVHIMLGPVLTFIIFKPGKKGLMFDLCFIAIVQLGALLYGGSILYQERPVFLVFAVDRFVLVSADDIEYDKLGQALVKGNERSGPVPVYAKLPEDEKLRIKFAMEVMQGAPDLEYRAEFYEPYANNLDYVLPKRLKVESLKKVSDEYRVKIEFFQSRFCKNNCAYFPLVGKKRDVLLVINIDNGLVLGGIELNPWVPEDPSINVSAIDVDF